ncbi:hypothetical protein SAMN04487944_11431 [Gracilibacillus ureilyticus]|uniref:Uncharacterized protein n=1 Tax=Gracilibacillus ureilyticus TaxID=531814 RepID=A0A1H9TJN4_9BACI|nr:hypothetical protein [Gracilibacillus ureilyticus]SER97267.1 hypothetical protein SAMN04487944_11431 [Gracilibacillus ureilyticus]
MRKTKMANIIGGAAVVGGLSYVLMDKTRRDNVKSKFKEIKQSVSNNNSSHLPVDEAGDPGKQGIQNSNMVAEGSQFGVNYYNKIRQ